MNLTVGWMVVGALLVLVQVLAALPWLAATFLTRADLTGLRRDLLTPRVLGRVAVVLVGVVVAPAVFQSFVQERGVLEACGQIYAAILQLQLIADFFVFAFLFLLFVWPKGGAVALAAFREGVRQPMFWLLVLIAWGLMSISPLVPYFTFGEDYLVVKELGYDTIMLAAVAFGALAASMFVSDEIEGKTAITLMSKPVSRRQFLLGKFAGLVLAALVIYGLLGTYFEGVLIFKHWWDRLGQDMPQNAAQAAQAGTNFELGRLGVVPAPPWLTATLAAWGLPAEATDFLRGVGLWTAHTIDTAPGLILSFSQVMVLVAIAVSLATRVPMVVNLVTILVIYFLAHLTPTLVTIGKQAKLASPDSAVAQMLAFMAQLSDTLLPDLGMFHLDPSLISDTPMPAGPFLQYLGSVTLYGVLYTSLALLFGLILFEDRDLA